MTTMRFKFDKLVRDKMPALMENGGVIVHKRTIRQDELVIKLKEKLLEEAAEAALEANSKEQLCEELADILEVVQSLAKSSGIDTEQIEKIRCLKKMTRGGFDQGFFCSYIEIDKDNSKSEFYLNYFKTHNRYPQIK